MFLLAMVAGVVAAYGIAELGWPGALQCQLARLNRALGGRGEPWVWGWPGHPPHRWEHRVGGALALLLAAWMLWAGLAAHALRAHCPPTEAAPRGATRTGTAQGLR